MITKDALLKVSEIICHANCPDGIGAAVICAAAYAKVGLKPDIKFIQYGTRAFAELEAKANQMFVDITPPRERWEEWKGMSPTVLDHHETARYVVEGLGGIYGGFDESGSMLAFENVMLRMSSLDSAEHDLWKRFAHLCMVRDTWKESHPDWAEASALAHALLLHGHDLAESASMTPLALCDLLTIGQKLYGRICRAASRISKHCRRQEISLPDGMARVAIFNYGINDSISDMANIVLNDSFDMAIGYFYTYEDNKMQCVVSLRTKNRISAAVLAQSFGGGGHARAAGFHVDGSIPPEAILSMVISKLESL